MSAQYQTENLTIHHKVKDYAAWRKGYDDHEKARNAVGITNGRVFRSAEDPNYSRAQRAWTGWPISSE